MATDQDVVAHRHGLEQGKILKRPTDPETGNAMARQLQQTLACEVNGAGAGLIEAAQTIEERRLAGAVRADQAADLPGLDIERDIVEGHDPAEAHRQSFDAEQWRAALRRHGRLRQVRA